MLYKLQTSILSIRRPAWFTKGTPPIVSINDLAIALDALKIVANRKNINGIDSIYWPGIELVNPHYFMSEDFMNYDPFEDGMPKEFPEAEEYADVDDDDDLGEVVFWYFRFERESYFINLLEAQYDITSSELGNKHDLLQQPQL